jgi:hypothetical protein
MHKSADRLIGHINFWAKLTRKPSSGNPNAGFDEAGAGNVLKYFSGAPVLDPTAQKKYFCNCFGRRR